MINNKSIGRKLKELRNSRNLRQSELAELVGLSRPAISNIESGKRSLTLSTLKRFCEDDINTSTANGLFMFNLKVNLAEHELKKGSERIKAVFEYKIAQGQPITGNVPFGYRIATENGNKRIVIDESKAPIVKDIFNSFLLHQSVHHTVEYVNKKYGLSRPYMSYMHILKKRILFWIISWKLQLRRAIHHERHIQCRSERITSQYTHRNTTTCIFIHWTFKMPRMPF